MFQKIRIAIRFLFIALGFYELLSVYKMMTGDSKILSQEHLYYPESYFQHPTKGLLAMFTLFLGIIRFLWSVGNNGTISWILNLVAHSSELIFLWNNATGRHFNPQGGSWLNLAQRVAGLQVGNSNSRLVLFIVPVLIGLLLLHGPGDWNEKNHVKAKRT
jgi:hypothetical protein